MKRTHRLLLLLSTLCAMVLSQGCTSPTCQDYLNHMTTCRDKMVGTFGNQVVVEAKDKSKSTVPCKKETERKDCGLGKYCVRAPGHATSTCYNPGNLYKQFKELSDEVKSQCVPIFAVRQSGSKQSGSKSYYKCIQNAKCDLRKINACQSQLTKEKKSGQGAMFIAFLLFLGLTLLLEGILLFVTLKFTDGLNPKVTLVRALTLAFIVGVVGFPAMYFSPLIGTALSSSLFFGLIIIFFYQGAGFPTFYTAFHIFWVSAFFNFMVANQHIGNKPWLFESKTLRVAMVTKHDKLSDTLEEYDQTQKEIAAARARAKKQAQEEAKQKALAKKKKQEEAKRKAEEEKKNKRRRRRRRRR